MNIIVAGCGKVGYTIAKELTEDGHSVAVIDKREDAFHKTEESIDVMMVRGNALSSEALVQAGVERAGLVVAVTAVDEANILCCTTAKRLGAKRAIARVRDPEFAEEMAALREELNIDLIINPELQAAREISRILRFKAVGDVETMAGGVVELVSFPVESEDFFAGKTVADFIGHLKFPVLFAAISRDGKAIIPHGGHRILAGDKVSVLGRSADITPFFRYIGKSPEKTRDALLIGGGTLAWYLYDMLEKHHIRVKIIERDEERCRELSVALPHAVVINGDGTDMDVLESESLEAADAVVCLLTHDEDNVLIGLNARQAGVEKVVVKLDDIRQNMVRKLGLDGLVYPKNITAYQVLRYAKGMSKARGGDMITFHRVIEAESGGVEALEFRAREGAAYIGKPLKDLRVRANTLVGCIVHRQDAVIAGGAAKIMAGDTVVALTGDESVTRLEDIFE